MAIVFHGLGHRVLEWWSKGCHRISEHDPDSGQYIEQRLFGDALEGWWLGEAGSVRHLVSISIECSNQTKVIGMCDELMIVESWAHYSFRGCVAAKDILEEFSVCDKSLALIDVTTLPSLVLANLDPRARLRRLSLRQKRLVEVADVGPEERVMLVGNQTLVRKPIVVCKRP